MCTRQKRRKKRKKRIDNVNEMRRSKYVHTHVSRFKIWGRSDAGRIDGFFAWNQEDWCHCKHISFTVDAWKGIPELHILLRHPARLLGSRRTVRWGGNNTFWASRVIAALHMDWNAETSEDSPFQTSCRTFCTPTMWSWSNAGPNQMLAFELPPKAAWTDLKIKF